MNTILERFGEHAVLNMLNGSPTSDGSTTPPLQSSTISPEQLAQLSAAFYATSCRRAAAEQLPGSYATPAVSDPENDAEWSSRGTSPEPNSASLSAMNFSPHSVMSLSMIREEGEAPQRPADQDQDAEDGVYLDLRTFMNCAPFAIRWVSQPVHLALI